MKVSTDWNQTIAPGGLHARSHAGAQVHKEAGLDFPAGEHGRAEAPALGYADSSRYVWYVICLLCVVNMCASMDRMALAVLAPLIKAELRLSDTQMGLLTGLTFTLFFAVSAFPIARWSDRGVRRNIMAIALVVWSAMTAVSGAAQNFWHLFVARVGLGAGEAGCSPPQASLVCDYVPLHRRTGVFSVTSFGAYAGTMIGMVAAGSLGEIIGWRWTFVALAVPGFALAALVRFTLREPTRGTFDARKSDQAVASSRETLQFLWRCKTYRWLILFLLANGFAQYGFNQWWPSFYERAFGLSVSTVGVYLGIAIGSASALGLLVGGLLGNKVAQRNLRLPLVIGAASIGLATLPATGSLLASSASVSIFLVWLTWLFLSISFGPITASANSVVKSRMRATALAVSILFSSGLGAGLGPLFVGMLSDILQPLFGAEALRYALIAPLCLMPVMAVTAYAASNTLLGDLSTAGEQSPASEWYRSRS
jgi:predicted MFS family arabinose efflux permease